MPSFYVSRGIGNLQADTNKILVEIGGLASGIFALAFTLPPPWTGGNYDAPPGPSPP